MQNSKLLVVACVLCFLASSKAVADELSYTCEVLHTYELERDGTISTSGFDEQFRGSRFSVSRIDGKVIGSVVPTLMAESTQVLQHGNNEYSFRAIAHFGHDVQLLEIREFVPAIKKPFIATALSGAGIVSGNCE